MFYTYKSMTNVYVEQVNFTLHGVLHMEKMSLKSQKDKSTYFFKTSLQVSTWNLRHK